MAAFVLVLLLTGLAASAAAPHGHPTNSKLRAEIAQFREKMKSHPKYNKACALLEILDEYPDIDLSPLSNSTILFPSNQALFSLDIRQLAKPIHSSKSPIKGTALSATARPDPPNKNQPNRKSPKVSPEKRAAFQRLTAFNVLRAPHSFAALQALPAGARLPTLLGGHASTIHRADNVGHAPGVRGPKRLALGWTDAKREEMAVVETADLWDGPLFKVHGVDRLAAAPPKK